MSLVEKYQKLQEGNRLLRLSMNNNDAELVSLQKYKKDMTGYQETLANYIQDAFINLREYNNNYGKDVDTDLGNQSSSPTNILKRVTRLVDAYKILLQTAHGSKYVLSDVYKKQLSEMQSELEKLDNKNEEQNVRITEAVKSVNEAKSQEDAIKALKAFEQLKNDIQVDVLGKVRVCVKMFTHTEKNKFLVKDNRNVKVSKTDLSCGPFWSVSESESNSVFYGDSHDSNSIAKVVSQVESGYSIIIMAIGASGSGKTHTMSGKEGLQVLAIQTLIDSRKMKSLAVKNILEDSMVSMDTGVRSNSQLSNRMKTDLISHSHYNNHVLYTNGDKIQETIKKLNDIEADITNKRLKLCRILPTVYNKASSRSHLCTLLRAEFNNGVVGFLTFFDMAGRESPSNIYNNWKKNDKPADDTKTTMATINKNTVIACETINMADENSTLQSHDKTPNKIYTPDMRNQERKKKEYIGFLMQQGVFINESMNLLEHYILSISVPGYANRKRSKYKSGYTNGDVLTEDEYSAAFHVPNGNNNRGLTNAPNIIFMLRYISKLSDQNNKPAKLVIVGTMKNDSSECDATLGTLEFLQKLLPNKNKNTLAQDNISNYCDKISQKRMQDTDGSK